MARAKKNKSQHYVAAGYLRPWCDPNAPSGHEPYVWTVGKDGKDPKRRAPANLFEDTDFYTLQTPEGERDLVVEEYLARVESEFCRVRDNAIARREALGPDDLGWLLTFMAAAHQRTKSQKEHWAKQWGHVVQVADDMARAVAEATPEQRKRMARIGDNSRGEPSMSHDEVKALAQQPMRALPALVKAEWEVLPHDGPHPLLHR